MSAKAERSRPFPTKVFVSFAIRSSADTLPLDAPIVASESGMVYDMGNNESNDIFE